MKRLSFFGCVIALGLGMALVLPGNRHHNLPSSDDTASEATDGAFRDGFYLGKLAAKRGDGSHIAVGRWTTAGDRASFTAGFKRGYSEALAVRMARANPGREAE